MLDDKTTQTNRHPDRTVRACTKRKEKLSRSSLISYKLTRSAKVGIYIPLPRTTLCRNAPTAVPTRHLHRRVACCHGESTRAGGTGGPPHQGNQWLPGPNRLIAHHPMNNEVSIYLSCHAKLWVLVP